MVEPTPLEKYAQVKLGIISPRYRGENKKYFKLTPSQRLLKPLQPEELKIKLIFVETEMCLNFVRLWLWCYGSKSRCQLVGSILGGSIGLSHSHGAITWKSKYRNGASNNQSIFCNVPCQCAIEIPFQWCFAHVKSKNTYMKLFFCSAKNLGDPIIYGCFQK